MNYITNKILSSNNFIRFFKRLFILVILITIPATIFAVSTNDSKFTVVIDAGHGGHDYGAIDNGVNEKDINLQVALKVGELCKKKLKDTQIIFTRDEDTFISLQKRADIANNAKADFFISIHTNSVDAKNKNRTLIEGASVYTQGPHKDEANMEIARRENSVIELENGFEQKYSGFDPNKDESYIIFEMAQKKNLSESARFAKNVQQNLVKIAGRKDRGVHQAGFWVLWSTSMPSVLIELDFICNPQSAKYLASKEGVDKLAEAIFQTIKVYEQNYLQKRRMIAEQSPNKTYKKEPVKKISSKNNKQEKDKDVKSSDNNINVNLSTSDKSEGIVLASTPEPEEKDLSHANLEATQNQRKPKYNTDGRRRRSEQAKSLSDEKIRTLEDIPIRNENVGNKVVEAFEQPIKSEKVETQTSAKVKAGNKSKPKAKANEVVSASSKHGGERKSLKSKK